MTNGGNINTAMETNYELELAYRCIENTDSHLFLTGRAGTGKTTFLHYLKEHSTKRMVVLAPTGIAAINAGGVTIHSFFQLPFAPYIPEAEYKMSKEFKYGKEKINIIRSLNLIVIDEISMVRADLLDAVDMLLRRYRQNNTPFGGVQLLMIGDVQQLAPVAKKEDKQLLSPYYSTLYFFGSHALKQTSYITIELKQVYRQKESLFLDLLNVVRSKEVDEKTLQLLNSRCIQPDEKSANVRLTTHNYQADEINNKFLRKLKTRSYEFKAEISGLFPESSYPTDELLILKKGAQVMFLKNAQGPIKKYYNGKIGVITSIDENHIEVCCQGEEEAFEVEPEEWTNTKYVLNKATKEISEQVEGSFRQYPLRLAWAITIHKSQGLTFDNVIIDVAAAFAHGQVYVALSRCRTLNGLILSSPIHAKGIIKDSQVDAFTRYMEQHQPDEHRLEAMEKQYYFSMIKEQFSFEKLYQQLQQLQSFSVKHLLKEYPQMNEKIAEVSADAETRLLSVAKQFEGQYTKLFRQAEDVYQDETLHARINAAANYFINYLISNFVPLNEMLDIEIDNIETEEQYKNVFNAFALELRIKLQTLSHCLEQKFSLQEYMRICSEQQIQKADIRKVSKVVGKKAVADMMYPELYEHLKEWRKMKASELNVRAYKICPNRALLAIANMQPQNEKELLEVPHVGKKTMQYYGNEILEIVLEFARNS